MSAENRALFQEFVNGLNNKDVSFVDRLVDPDFVDHDPAPGQAPGLQGIKDLMQMFFTAFPDLHVTVNRLVADEDTVAGAVTTEGTQDGDFMGIPKSGMKISITELHMMRIANGKMVEHWGVGDGMTMMQQLGVMGED
ncbi:MAG: ester cyclase [Dehalococcoidia bacterium]|nr:ester cyclase [Dehalococcoidia bacterium]